MLKNKKTVDTTRVHPETNPNLSLAFGPQQILKNTLFLLVLFCRWFLIFSGFRPRVAADIWQQMRRFWIDEWHRFVILNQWITSIVKCTFQRLAVDRFRCGISSSRSAATSSSCLRLNARRSRCRIGSSKGIDTSSSHLRW